jgi:hypothetical protein
VENDLNFKEWLSDEQWSALKQAVTAGTRAYRQAMKKDKKPKPKVKKENRKAPKQEDLHKWLLEKKKLPGFLMRVESSSQN